MWSTARYVIVIFALLMITAITIFKFLQNFYYKKYSIKVSQKNIKLKKNALKMKEFEIFSHHKIFFYNRIFIFICKNK